MIYYIGDMHLGHKNVIEYDGRPFESVEKMDAVLIENWNRVVKDIDDVYIIGDFVYRSSHEASYYLKQLKGRKHLIIGNHDLKTIEDKYACACFESMERMGYIKDENRDIVMCHYPIAEWNGKQRNKNAAYHVYSHIHNRNDVVYDFMRQQKGALNAGCMINNYMPVTLSQLIENNQEYIRKTKVSARRHYEIFATLREDLSSNEREFIIEKISELKKKYNISEEDGTFYRANIHGCDDVAPCVAFLVNLDRKYKEYFKAITYNSYLEGIIGGSLIDR